MGAEHRQMYEYAAEPLVFSLYFASAFAEPEILDQRGFFLVMTHSVRALLGAVPDDAVEVRLGAMVAVNGIDMTKNSFQWVNWSSGAWKCKVWIQGECTSAAVTRSDRQHAYGRVVIFLRRYLITLYI